MRIIQVYFKPKVEGFEPKLFTLFQKNDKIADLEEKVIRRMISLLNKTQGEEFDELYEIQISNTKDNCPINVFFPNFD